jgi:hypothetical protein
MPRPQIAKVPREAGDPGLQFYDDEDGGEKNEEVYDANLLHVVVLLLLKEVDYVYWSSKSYVSSYAYSHERGAGRRLVVGPHPLC